VYFNVITVEFYKSTKSQEIGPITGPKTLPCGPPLLGGRHNWHKHSLCTITQQVF